VSGPRDPGDPQAPALREADERDRPAWDEFVRGRPEADPLQLWVWGEVAALGGEPPRRLLLEGPDRALRGVAQVLVRATSGGHTVLYAPHGPLWQREAADGPSLLAALLDGLRELARETRGILVIVDPRAVPGDDAATDALGATLLGAGLRAAKHDLQARTTRLIALRDGGEALQASWHPDARRRVRRAAKEGVTTTVDRVGDPAALAAFHELWLATGERADFRTRSLEAVKALAYGSAAADGWYLALAWREGRAIAGVACPRLADRGHYLWAASARDPELTHAYGGYAALAALMVALAEDAATTLDLWGVAEADDAAADDAWAGFSSFKRKFDGQPLRHPGTFELVIDPVWYRLRALRERVGGG